jgi:type IV secretory pathway TrbD component
MQNQPTTPPTVSSPVNPNQQPRQRFQLDATRIRLHREMVDSETFLKGADYAMLQFSGALAVQVTDSAAAMAAGYQLLGAWTFLATLKTLAETPAKSQRTPTTDNLDHSRS